jgi:hypoxanthine phosphoribosyltransferase
VLLPGDAARADRRVSEPEAAVGHLLDPDELAAIARRLGSEIARDYPEGVVLVALLKGSLCFLADLVRELPGPCELDFLVLSAYGDGQTRVRVTKDLDLDVTGRDVVVVMDLVDTGLTLGYVLRLIALRRARSTAACALLDRRSRRLLPVELRYVGRASWVRSTSSATVSISTSATGTCPQLEVADESELRTDPRAMFERLSRR